MIFHKLLYFLVKNASFVFHTIYNRLSVRGRENIPDGTLVVASNHASNIDPPLIGGVFPRRLRYLAKESLFHNPLLGFLIDTLGAIPVKREDSQSAGAVMKMMLRLLEGGESLLLFPEGSRTPDGRLQPLEGGAALLSIKTGVPILPVYIAGSHAICPPGKILPRPAKLTVTFAAPLYPDSYDCANDREKRAAMMRDLEGILRGLEREATGA